ncbi:MAG: hypothetical protein R3C14_16785 [Caldilineaceae bacterium]
MLQVNAQITFDDLLNAVRQLSVPELERFSEFVLRLQAQQKAVSLPPNESALLLKINTGLGAETQTRYDQLIAKRRSETLTTDEYAELLGLTQQAEQIDGQRLEALAELATLRNVPLKTVMQQLEIQTPAYA